MAKNKTIIPTVLSFEKKLVPSDGYFYSTSWDSRKDNAESLSLVEKSVRGTISNRLEEAVRNDPLKLNAKIENPNCQIIDACALNECHDTLRINFTLKILGGVETPSACNKEDFLHRYQQATKNYIDKYGFKELAKRYALNIANGRFLWRNRVGAEKVEVNVSIEDEVKLSFNALDYPLHKFDTIDNDLRILADKIALALSGKLSYLLIKVEAYTLVGKGQEVYPSEELVFDKGNGNKSKILYHVNNVAAMHSQKIGNAIRTIDTWYPKFVDKQTAIAIDPYGAVTNLGKAYRSPYDNVDFFSLFDKKYVLDETLRDEDEHYVMAVLVRGGVFGQSGKESD